MLEESINIEFCSQQQSLPKMRAKQILFRKKNKNQAETPRELQHNTKVTCK